jgi:ABC-type multidrug transport system permease subunit
MGNYLFTYLIISLVFLQVTAIIVHGIILLQYRKICGHCDWWSDLGAFIFFIVTFIPVIGIIECMAGPFDYIRNIKETLAK